MESYLVKLIKEIMSFSNQSAGTTYRTQPISNISVYKNTVMFLNASGRQKVTLDSTAERIQFIKWLLS